MDLGTKEVRSIPHCQSVTASDGDSEREQCSRLQPCRSGGREREGPPAGRGLRPAGCRLAPAREREGGQGPTACRLAPAAACLATCALRLAPEAGPEGRGRPLPSAVALAGGGWGLGVGADPRMRVVRWWRTGVRERRRRGWGEPAKGRGARSVETSSSMLGWASSNKLKKKILGRTPGHGPGGPGSKSAPANLHQPFA